jgi:hypothetical protein
MIPGIKKQHQAKVKEIVVKMSEVFARVDEDGFGYAAITSQGKIYGEKWLKKADVFNLHEQPAIDPLAQKIQDFFGPAAGKSDLVVGTTENKYASFGDRSPEAVDDTVAMIFHARKKTFGEKTIENCHPFVELNDANAPDTAVIHNGSIVNHLSLTKKYSTCDSETILHEYLKQVTYYNPQSIQKIASTLIGEYTVGVLSSIEENNSVTPILDIFKSNKELYGCYVKDIETYLFTTSDWQLKAVLTEMKLDYVGVTEIKDGFLLRINAITGERIDDVIPFVTSLRSIPVGETKYIGPQKLPQTAIKVVANKPEHSKSRYGDFFTDVYFDVPTGLTEVEKQFLDEIEANETEYKALRLTKKIMNF